MTDLTPDRVAEVLRVYHASSRSPFKTGRALNISTAEVFAVLDHAGEAATGRRGCVAEERHGGHGRPELAKYLVARRQASASGGWDYDDPEIAAARENYEAGTHEMATGRDGSWLLLYSIPRRYRAPDREGFFTQCGI